MSSNEKLIVLDDVCKHFKVSGGMLKAVDHISLDIYKGENFGLVGESGCGKTTLGRTLIRLYNPTSGEILFNGKNISGKLSKADRDYVTRNLSMIFQDPVSSLNPRMTVEEIIAEGLKTRGEKDKELIRKSVSSILNKVGLLPEHGSRYPHEFSGGQRQRIGIARSLVVKPSVIIADEPVSALDVSIQAQIVNLLIRLQKEKGLTYLFIAHDLAMVKHISDRVAVMYLGNIVEITQASALYANPMHPYTQALLSAIPIPDPEVEEKKQRIRLEGELPSPVDPPEGCRFINRCRFASERCRKERPELMEMEPGHLVACHYCEEMKKGTVG